MAKETAQNTEPKNVLAVGVRAESMSPARAEEHAKWVLANKDQKDVFTFVKYLEEFIKEVKGLLKTMPLIEKGTVHNGFKFSTRTTKTIVDQEPTEQMVEVQETIKGLAAKLKVEKDKLKVLEQAEIVKGNGREVEETINTVSFVS